MAPLSRRTLGLGLLNEPAQIFFYQRKLGNHLRDTLGFDAGKSARDRLLAQYAQPFEQGPGSRRQEQPLGAAVGGIRPPFDQAAVAELVEQARQCDGL